MSLPEFSRISKEIALAFHDVLLEPAASSVGQKEISLASFFSKTIPLNAPFAACTSHKDLAILLAQSGGIGIVPCDTTISRQTEVVRKVKSYQSRIVRNVITAAPETSIAEMLEYKTRYDLSVIPVLESGTRVLAGFLILDDKISYDDPDKTVAHFMSDAPFTTIKEDADISEAYKIMAETGVTHVAMVDEAGRCTGLVTKEDKDKAEKSPLATMDRNGCLRVAAAVCTGEEHFDRVNALIDAGVDAIVVDMVHGHSKKVLDMVSFIRRQRSGNVDVIAGNIATSEAAFALMDAGATGIKVGIHKGAVSVPQLTAIIQVAEACLMRGIPVIADGGIFSGSDAVKAFAAGTTSMMIDADEKEIEAQIKALSADLSAAMEYTGCCTLREFNTRPRFIRVSK
ncbi:MAG: guaB [Alphaproteobacteria bacterium]|nr:guaB [Alphaproteobacteria bacterium]